MSNPLQPLSSLPIPPSSLSALSKAGYQSIDDLPRYDSANQLTDALKIPIDASHAIYSSSQKLPESNTLPLTQSAAALIGSSKLKSKTFSTNCPPVDALLNGGVTEGHILEISGPPGSPKELVLLNILRSFVEARKSVLFVDCQNMCDPRLIADHLQGLPDAQQLISYVKIDNLTEFMVFMHNLTSYTNMSLLAISSISFPFQNTGRLSNAAKNNLLEKIKQTFIKLCTSQNVTIAITSQLATKMLNADGSPGTFDTAGAKGVMVPQLGSTYLPSGRTSRILLALNGANRG
ncbi:hypothetical protein GYMLUDRAFT_237532 [Collybiopsis luxurians FD-317 M1]|nr:hypothetical protein GYMLUDRAFT_237532 [Collybiopsis luxurians FD-317 M1]